MSMQYYGVTLLLIWLQLAGLAAFFGPRLGSWALGRSCGILLIVLSLFFIEHFIGLGSLNAVWIFSTFGSGYYLWKKMPALRASTFLKSELVFIFAVLLGLLWKACFPNIYPTSERIPDLYFIGNYLSGATLPPLDHWFPPNRFDFYFALQHYAAALIAREYRLMPGLAYNIRFAVLMALPLTLAWEVASRFLAYRWHKILLVAALAIGGTGAPVFTHFILEPQPNANNESMAELYNTRMWGNARLIGQYDQIGNTRFANALFPKPGMSKPDLQQLPLENFGYQYYIGDYHPPLGGFFLLLLALCLIVSLETSPDEKPVVRLAQKAFLMLTVPAAIATNAWVFPLQAVLVIGWLVWRQLRAKTSPLTPRSWPVLAGAMVAGFILLAPFLVGISAYPIPSPAFVQNHSPLIPTLALMWPLLVLIALGLFSKDVRKHAFFFALVFGVLLLVSEFVFIDDAASGIYQRTNTTSNWWGWLWTGGLVVLGAALLASNRKWIRWSTAAALGCTLLYTVDVLHYFDMTDERFFGQLAADRVYTQVRVVSDIFQHLRESPDGIVLENIYTDDAGDGGIYGTFAGKPNLLGWPAHVIAWHGKADEVNLRKDQIRAFYAGTLPNPLEWLRKQNVSYIVWSPHDTLNEAIRVRYREEFKDAYFWRSAGLWDGARAGVWARRN